MEKEVSLQNTKALLIALVVGFSGVLAGCQTTQTVSSGQVGAGQPISTKPMAPEQDRFDIRMKLAVAYFQGGKENANTALAEVNKALELRPRSAEALSLKGMIYDQMGDAPNAIAHLKSAVSIDPNNGDLMHNLGTMLCNQGQYMDGAAHLEKAVSLPNNTNVVRSWVMIGECYRKAGSVQRAETAYHQVLYLEPSNVVALAQLGDMMYSRNDIV
ncbi:MAG: tetratricopeptide repeat protein, partial [Saezia sp.]